MAHRKGQTIHSEARTLIKRIAEKCEEEALKNQLLHPLHMPIIRAAEYSGIATSTIRKIKHESSSSETGILSSPGKKRPKSIEKKFHCSYEDETLIRNIINNFYIEKKIVPTGPKLLAAIREEIDFPWSMDSLHRLLKKMGFKWKKSNNNRKILIEKPNIVVWRGKYLKALRNYRRENKNIIYIDETWVDNTLTFGKCWQSDEQLGVLQNKSSSHRLIIVHAGGMSGFVPNAALIFKARSTSGDYHGQMNAINFEKWMKEKLLPNIPQNTVVVMDNAPYHSVQTNKAPSKYAKKAEMINWLTQNNISHFAGMKKYELAELIERHKAPEKTYKIDEIIKSRGYNVLRLPPYMCDLNPIEFIWAQIKRKIREKNISTLTLDRLLSLTQEAIDAITATEWENVCKHIIEIENSYWDKDNLLEEAMENLELNIQETDSEDPDDNSSSEDV